MQQKIYRDDIPPELRFTNHIAPRYFLGLKLFISSFVDIEKSLYKWYDSLNADTISSILGDGELRKRVDETIDNLQNHIQEEIIRLRYGLEDGKVWSLEEISEKVEKTRQNVNQHELKALNKLRHHSRSRELRDYIKQYV